MLNFRLKFQKIIKQCRHCSNKIAWLVSGLLFMVALIFLYNNFYKAVGDAGVLLKLKSQVALEVVDMEMWKKINQEIEWKKQPLAEEGLERNPFE